MSPHELLPLSVDTANSISISRIVALLRRATVYQRIERVSTVYQRIERVSTVYQRIERLSTVYQRIERVSIVYQRVAIT